MQTPDLAGARIPARRKASLLVEIWRTHVNVRSELKRYPLPAVVEHLSTDGPDDRETGPRILPRRLGLVVYRALWIGRLGPRCLITALVLYRLLVRRGDHPTLVIGLPDRPRSKDAHAWIEVDGIDVGPPPGGGGHVPLARYTDGSAER
jgi:hypothetical protein